MEKVKILIQKYLSGLEKKLDCRIQFIPITNQKDIQDNAFIYKEGKIGMPFFFKGQCCGHFFIEGHSADEKSLQVLEVLIQKELKDFFEKYTTLFYLQNILPEKHRDQNMVSLFKKDMAQTSAAQILFVRAESKDEALLKARHIHKSTSHIAFMHLDQLMKKEGSFKDWSTLFFTTLFFPHWAEAKKWQKKQIKDFILASKTPLPLKIIIRLEKEVSPWRVF